MKLRAPSKDSLEFAIRDLEQGSGLNHAPSGHFFANAAWLLACCLAHNLARWIARLGLHLSGPIVAQTIRRRYLTLPGRITRSARRSTLHLARSLALVGELDAGASDAEARLGERQLEQGAGGVARDRR